ncbi:MAG: hypothetical protein ABIK97_02600 [candidate division WOR-3 bacterium]
MRRGSLVGFLAFFLFGFDLVGEKISFSFRYDTNPFLLSDSQRDDFLSGKEMGIKTYDDLLTRISFQPFSWAIKEYRFSFTFTGNFYYQNPIKSYTQFRTQGKRFFGRVNRFGVIEYEFCPYYLIRPLKKGNLTYTSHSWEGELTSKKTSLLFSFSLRDYPALYNAYDSKIYSLGLRSAFGEIRSAFGEIRGEFKLNFLSADGRLSTSGEKPDISYRGIMGKLGYQSRIGLAISLSLEKRDFTTKIDPTHRGRKDLIGEMEFSFSFPLKKKSYLSFGYLYKKRKSNSESEEISEEKSYEKSIFSLGVRYE